MNKFIIILLLAAGIYSCAPKKHEAPDPEYELGQKMTFNGADPEQTFIIVGYRQSYQSPVEKEWKDQEYIVFIYVNKQNDISEATIHRNALLK